MLILGLSRVDRKAQNPLELVYYLSQVLLIFGFEFHCTKARFLVLKF